MRALSSAGDLLRRMHASPPEICLCGSLKGTEAREMANEGAVVSR